MRSARVLTTVLLLSLPAAALATPQAISYQAILTDTAGLPVADGGYSVTFSIYNSSSGGSALWTETQSVSTQSGLFSTTLGLVTPIPDSVVADTAAYLQLSVESDPPMSPRTRLASTPYALTSASVRGLGPVELEHEDVASGEISTYSLAVTPDASGAAGKNIRKNITVTLPTRSGATTESLDLDSGYMTTVRFEDGDDTISQTEIVHLTGDPVLNAGQAVAIPAFMKNSRKAKTAESAETREILDTDSGFAQRVTLQSPSGNTEKSLILAPSTSAAIAVPNLIEARKGSSAFATAETRLIVDPDSGFAETATTLADTVTTILSMGTSQTKEHVLLARQVSVPIGGTKTRQLTLITDVDSAMAVFQCEDENGNGSEARKGASESAAISSLRTLVPTQATHAEMKTDAMASSLSLQSEGLSAGSKNSRSTIRCEDLGSELSLGLATPTDTSDVDIVVTETEQSITLSTTESGTKWPNIVLKRGATASEMTLSHVGAGTTGVIHATADAATGAQLGINTSNPSQAFHLVGSGCYTGTFGACSDRRFKDHVSTLSNPLTTLRRLRGVSYTWRQKEFPAQKFPSGQQVGLIAQEVESVIPGVVTTGDDGYKSVDYAKLVPLLIEAVKAQQRQIDDLKARLDGSGRLTSAGN